MTEETTPNTAETPSRDERIGKLAYQIWEEEGRPEGQQDEHWYRACAIIDQEEMNAAPLPDYLKKEEPGIDPGLAAATGIPASLGKEEKPSLEELTRRMRSRSAA